MRVLYGKTQSFFLESGRGQSSCIRRYHTYLRLDHRSGTVQRYMTMSDKRWKKDIHFRLGAGPPRTRPTLTVIHCDWIITHSRKFLRSLGQSHGSRGRNIGDIIANIQSDSEPRYRIIHRGRLIISTLNQRELSRSELSSEMATISTLLAPTNRTESLMVFDRVNGIRTDIILSIVDPEWLQDNHWDSQATCTAAEWEEWRQRAE